MDKNYLIQLTNNLYKLTLLFPKKEPLRYKMRELADEILAKPTEKNLEILDSFFEVAKAQNWVSPSQLLGIQKEYSKIREGLKSFSETEPRKVEKVAKAESKLSEVKPPTFKRTFPERQQKILEFLKEKGKAQVGEFKKIFPEVTKRTLRRDFEQLLKQGSIERIGERNETFYQPRRPASPEPQRGEQAGQIKPR